MDIKNTKLIKFVFDKEEGLIQGLLASPEEEGNIEFILEYHSDGNIKGVYLYTLEGDEIYIPLKGIDIYPVPGGVDITFYPEEE